MSRLLLLSGGIDSVAIAAWLRPEICLTIDYGQNSAGAEIKASEQVCIDLGLQHQKLKANINAIGAGAMSDQPISSHSKYSEFWPYRNQYLVTLAAMVAIQKNFKEIIIGTVATDNRHKDGSSEFIRTLNSLLRMQEGELELVAPAQNITTMQLVKKSGINMRTLAWSHSCYLNDLACGQCDGCYKHSQLMNELGFIR